MLLFVNHPLPPHINGRNASKHTKPNQGHPSPQEAGGKADHKLTPFLKQYGYTFEDRTNSPSEKTLHLAWV
jgi:hypothetical protein